VASALAHREELGQGDAGIREAGAAKRIATAALLPSVAGAFDVGWQGRTESFSRDDRFWSASLVASWDLFRASDLAQRTAARHAEERARVVRRDAADQITVEVRNAHEAARVARAAIATAATRAEAARRTFTLVRRRYEEGSASPVELVDARTSLTSAESNQLLTLYRYAIRRVDLERAAALRDLPLTKGELR
jgi:outer membrane protein TolC